MMMMTDDDIHTVHTVFSPNEAVHTSVGIQKKTCFPTNVFVHTFFCRNACAQGYLLLREGLCTQTQMLLNTGACAQKSLHTYTHMILHRRPCTHRKFLHTEVPTSARQVLMHHDAPKALTHNSIYTQNLGEAFTCRLFYKRKIYTLVPLRTDAFTYIALTH